MATRVPVVLWSGTVAERLLPYPSRFAWCVFCRPEPLFSKREPASFRNLASLSPNLPLVIESSAGFQSHSPSERICSDAFEQVKWNPRKRMSIMFRKFENLCSSFVEPPLQEVPPGKPIGSNWMIHNGTGLVVNLFPAIEDSSSKLRVFAANRAIRPGSQVGSKVAVSFEYPFSKGHVRSKRRFSQLTGLLSRVKRDQWRENVSRRGQPFRTLSFPEWNDPASGTGPTIRLQ